MFFKKANPNEITISKSEYEELSKKAIEGSATNMELEKNLTEILKNVKI